MPISEINGLIWSLKDVNKLSAVLCPFEVVFEKEK